MRKDRFVPLVSLIAVCSIVPVCLARQENQPPQQQTVPGPCRLCAEIAMGVNRDLISLQPMNGYLVEAGLASWEDMRRGLSEPEAKRYDRCFQDLSNAYNFVLNAANAWAMASQTRVSVPIDNLLSLNYELRMSLLSARAFLERAIGCCRPPQQPSKPED